MMEQPCFISDAKAREFNWMVDHVRRSIHACGVDHACGVAADLADLSHDPEALMRCALAEVASDRLAASLSDGAAQPNEEERSALYVKLIERAVG